MNHSCSFTDIRVKQKKKGNKTMKKTYMNPTTDIVRVETQQMIAQSLGVNSSETIKDTNKILSRQGGAWDDDED